MEDKREGELIAIYCCPRRRCGLVFEESLEGNNLPLVVSCKGCDMPSEFLDLWCGDRIFTLIECPTVDDMREADYKRRKEKIKQRLTTGK